MQTRRPDDELRRTWLMLAMLPLAHARASSAVWGTDGHWSVGPGKLPIDEPYKDEHPLWGPETPADEAMVALDGWLRGGGELRMVATLPVALPVHLDVARLQALLDLDTFVSGALHVEDRVDRLLSPLDTLKGHLYRVCECPIIDVDAAFEWDGVRIISQSPLEAIMRMAAVVAVDGDGQREHTAAMWLQSSGSFMGLRYELVGQLECSTDKQLQVLGSSVTMHCEQVGRQSILLDTKSWNRIVHPDLEGMGSAGYRFDVRGAVEALSAHCPVARELAKELKL